MSKRPHKYRAKPTIYNGVRYDSKAEAARAAQLDMLVRSGDVESWERQPKFLLGEPGVKYVADFMVAYSNGQRIVEDVKGYETALFKLKKALWKQCGPYTLVILKGRDKNDGNYAWTREVIEPETKT